MIARSTIDQIADIILANESDFLDEDGRYDTQYIAERFDLSKEAVRQLLRELDKRTL